MAPAATSVPFSDLELSIGSVLAGKWRLDEVLGSGGMAVVYGATHRNGSRVAIKVMRHHAARDRELVQRFTKEGHVGNLVDHPGVVRTMDDGTTEDGTPYLVMERLDGESLEERIARTRGLSVDDAVGIVDSVLDALAAAHAKGLVHRDIKPGNVFITRDGTVKLFDFGIARERVLGGQNETVAGLVFGTPAFMPPEQARGRWDQVGPRSDLWAVAATLFVAATGRLLREGGTPTEELLMALQPLAAIRERAPTLPRALCDFLDRGLAYDIEARFPSAREMQLALRAAIALAPVVEHPLPPKVSVYRAALTTSIPMNPVRGRILAAAGASAALLLALLLYCTRSTEGSAPRVSLPAPPVAPAAMPSAVASPTTALPLAPVPEVALSSLAPSTAAARPSRLEAHAPSAPRASASSSRHGADPLLGRF